MDRPPLVCKRKIPFFRVQSRKPCVCGRTWHTGGRGRNSTFISLGITRHPLPPLLSYALPDNQLKVINATKTPFAVSDCGFIVIRGEVKYLTPSFPGEERRSHFESRILLDKGNPHLHRKVFPGDIRCGFWHCRNREWPDLGHCLSTTPRTPRQRRWWSCNWGNWTRFTWSGCQSLTFHVTGRRRWPPTRRRLVSGNSPPLCTLTERR